MSCSSCERESDNKHFQCAPKMADGRAFTDYKPRCAIHSTLMQNQSLNSYELRQHMINNAENIMQRSRESVEHMNACGPCVKPWNQGTMLPEQTVVKCNASTCSQVTANPDGLGVGRDYGIVPDLDFMKNMETKDALMRQQPANCCTGYDDDIKYFPITPVAEERYAIPSGGSPW